MPGVKSAVRLAPQCTAEASDYIASIAWFPCGDRVALACADGSVWVADRCDGTARRVGAHAHGAMSTSVRADGALIASSGQDGTVALWDATSLAERMRLPGDAPWIEHVAFQPKGTLLASAGGKHLKLWASDGRLVHATSAHPSTIAAIAWDAAGRQIGLAAYGGLWIHGVAGAKLATRSLAWQGAALTVAWSPSGKVIASGMQDGTVHFWRAGERVSAQMSGYPGKVRETSWSASGRYLATGGGAQITVWDFRGKGPEGTRPIQLD